MKFNFFISILTLAALSTAFLNAETPQIEKIQEGQHLYGAPVDKKELLGKVVVLKLWGMN